MNEAQAEIIRRWIEKWRSDYPFELALVIREYLDDFEFIEDDEG